MLYSDAFHERMTWASGIFYRSAVWGDFEIDSAEGFDFTNRVTGLLLERPESGSRIHLGMSLLLRRNASDLEISSQPESQLTDTYYVDTGDFDVDHTSILNVEMVWQRGPLSVQGEVTRSWLAATGDDSVYSGAYGFASYFLTGEHRPYNRRSASFGRVQPIRPVSFHQGGWGAWELALRLSAINLDEGAALGGREFNQTLGLNWYLRHDLRMMLNYVHGRVDSRGDGRFNILQARLQYAF